MKNKTLKTVLTVLFAILYTAVGFVSVYHAIFFFGLSNAPWLGVILACAFEIGQAAVLFYLLISEDKKVLPWILMIILTIVQILGNVYSSYKYMVVHNAADIQYFTDSVLFYLQDPNPKVNQVMISYITGAILPIVSLLMTSMVVNVLNSKPKEESTEVEATPLTHEWLPKDVQDEISAEEAEEPKEEPKEEVEEPKEEAEEPKPVEKVVF